ncbi:F0F1 ATP synthase subunit delta [Lactobacillus sp.] [Lactiplantibacillus mudanjiangensis]|uniref:ATP synthase F1 subunit delta n=1 Tax=Lactiplantibacillus mudanjiangensis TaxID=1296538 RepID=UPI00101491C4|nr:ATP synthase F1 subunit delta [Lactiplantibacillus mudanjiangensis]VDG19143.1 F0F1 ATP synthase subunit delta [Lactobacillus sp.] [Lactiplantibacillus mudanjiangensis]VDG33216.1 F0F1 ATP synthase subunit delta [Lactobacillus sp.] [Lactiplantibacillus mudanjiangensis]
MSLDNLTIANRYSKALFELAAEKDQTEAFLTELKQLRQVFIDNPQLAEVLAGSLLTVDQKQTTLRTLTDQASEYIKNFIQMLYDYGRMRNLVAIIDAFEQRYDDAQQIVHAEVTSAVKLSDEQAKAIAAAFAKRVGAKQVQLTQKVDPEIIGGVIVKSNNQTFDGSVALQLMNLKRALINN